MKTKFVALALLCLLFGLPAFGQTFGEITGEVRDTSGASVPGVNVTIINAATNANRSTVSTEAGIYSFPSLPPGVYNLRAEKQGSGRRTWERQDSRAADRRCVRCEPGTFFDRVHRARQRGSYRCLDRLCRSGSEGLQA